jgi:hypothetical protein
VGADRATDIDCTLLILPPDLAPQHFFAAAHQEWQTAMRDF